jgi:hypothetical protein
MTVSPDQAIASGGLQDAVARILTDPAGLEQLAAGQQHRLRERFGLTDGQLAMLATVDLVALRRFRRVLQLKRLGMAGALLPATVAVLRTAGSFESLAADFWTACPPASGTASGTASDDVRETSIRDLLVYTRGLNPATWPGWLPDLARYEATRALLGCRQAEDSQEGPWTDRCDAGLSSAGHFRGPGFVLSWPS